MNAVFIIASLWLLLETVLQSTQFFPYTLYKKNNNIRPVCYKNISS